MFALISLFLAILLSIVVTRIATVALVHTGLSTEAARFQARSALSGTGFTTQEAEQVINHPVRRRIIMMLMLLGNAGLVTVMTSLILTFVGNQATSTIVERVLMLAVGLLALAWFAYSRWVDRQLSRIIDAALRRMSDLDTRDYVSLLHLAGEYRLVEMMVRRDDWIAGMRLMDARPRNEGVMVLAIERETDGFLGTPAGDTVIQPGDTLLLYGEASALRALDRRRKGWEGDREHFEAVAEHKVRRNQEKKKDSERMNESAGDPGASEASSASPDDSE
ncbi:MAG TPA: TrkA C-terminal domain-containing protein [Gammaproteobacteria bacterium]|nr:TrkA C-terminal domain-containing protein [Gammaproteobacteria bacterium]